MRGKQHRLAADTQVLFGGGREAAQRRLREMIERACQVLEPAHLNLLAFTISVHIGGSEGDYFETDQFRRELDVEQNQMLDRMLGAVKPKPPEA